MSKWFRPGTIYCLRVRRHGRGRIVRGYIGKTRYRDYRKRCDEHFYGCRYGGVWNPPKYWAHEVVDYYPMWQGNWTDWGLSVREFLCIRVFFPIHNILLNQGNPRRVIPPPLPHRVYPTRDQITAVERYPARRAPWDRGHRTMVRGAPEMRARQRRDGRVEWSGTRVRTRVVPVGTSPYSTQQGTATAPQVPRPGKRLTIWLVLAALGVLFLPGFPAWTATTLVWEWVDTYANPIGGTLLVGGLTVLILGHQPKKRRRTRTRRR